MSDETVDALAEALDALEEVCRQECYRYEETGKSDSGALSAFAFGLEVLAKYGRFIVEPPVVGRMVIGWWPEDAPAARKPAGESEENDGE